MLGTLVSISHLISLILTAALQGKCGHSWLTDEENVEQSG